MTAGDFLLTLQWWLTIFLIGLPFLPLTALIFRHFFDKGYIFSKILGILGLSYTMWLLASLQIISFHLISLLAIFALFTVGGIYLSGKYALLPTLQRSWKIFALEEVLFLAALTFWAYVRAHEPSVYGLEKYMDFGFINSILRSDFFPPKDLWLASNFATNPPAIYTINYYYFGHLVAAVLTKLSLLNPVIAYNLMLANIFGLGVAGAFSLGANLYNYFAQSEVVKNFSQTRLLIAGAISAFLVNLGGNLHTIYAFFQSYPDAEKPIPFWDLVFDLSANSYWYPNATRFIPNTIHEFPLYSYVVADLHGHVFNIPFVLLTIAFLIIIYQKAQPKVYHFLALGLLIAVLMMTNVLDGPIYLLATFLVLFASYIQKSNLDQTIIKTLKDTAITSVAAIAFSLPFWLNFIPFGSGIGVLCAPEFLTSIGHIGPFLFEPDHCMRSPLWMMAILWGFPYLLALGFGAYILKWKLQSLKSSPINILTLILLILASILIIIPEFFYVKDIYPAHYRANTVFKLGYQAFIIFGLVSSLITIRLFSQKRPSWLYLTFFFLFAGLVAIYPHFAINSYYSHLQTYKGLNGLQYLAARNPSDHNAILWLQQNVPGQPTILEAQGESYSDYARISANTGLPTVIGWPVHEWLWRGSPTEGNSRSSEVALMYESPDQNTTKQLLDKYQVEYVVVGNLEREKYRNLNESKFAALGKIVFEEGSTRIYRINR